MGSRTLSSSIGPSENMSSDVQKAQRNRLEHAATQVEFIGEASSGLHQQETEALRYPSDPTLQIIKIQSQGELINPIMSLSN